MCVRGNPLLELSGRFQRYLLSRASTEAEIEQPWDPQDYSTHVCTWGKRERVSNDNRQCSRIQSNGKRGVRTPPNRVLHPSTVSASKLPFAYIGALAVVWAWLGISKKIGRHRRHKGSPEYTSPHLGSRSQGRRETLLHCRKKIRLLGAPPFSHFYFFF